MLISTLKDVHFSILQHQIRRSAILLLTLYSRKMLRLQNIVLFRISVRVAVLNFYRLIFTKGINQAKLKDGSDLIADHKLHTIYAYQSYKIMG